MLTPQNPVLLTPPENDLRDPHRRRNAVASSVFLAEHPWRGREPRPFLLSKPLSALRVCDTVVPVPHSSSPAAAHL